MEIDKSKFHKEVIGPFTGQHFIIRRVRLKEFMTALGTLPLTLTNTVQDILESLKERAAAGDKETEAKVTEFYATKGLVSPKAWFGEEKDCPEDQLYFADLGGDLDYVVSEIISYSHEMAGLKDYEKFFRESGTGAAGPNGETVWPEAIEPVAKEELSH